jgi:hypothetical protein
MEVGGQRHALAVLPPGKTRFTLCRRLGGPQVRSGQVRKISSIPGFDPRTVQPVACHCTAYAVSAHGSYGNYMEYASFPWPPLEAALPVSEFCFLFSRYV